MSAQNLYKGPQGPSEIPKLIAKQRELMKHESILMECSALIREERNKLQIEHLQLESMIARMKRESTQERLSQPAPIPVFKPLDLDSASKINSQSLDLSIGNSLTKMLEGKFYPDEFEEEEDEEEEEEGVESLTINDCLTLDDD